jgi:hypothetical protein
MGVESVALGSGEVVANGREFEREYGFGGVRKRGERRQRMLRGDGVMADRVELGAVFPLSSEALLGARKNC